MSHSRPADAVSTTALAATVLLVLGAMRTTTPVPLLPVVAVVVAAASFRRWRAAPAVAAIGWLTDLAFTRAPYAQLQLRGTHPVEGLVILTTVGLAAAAVGALVRRVRPHRPRCVVCAVEQTAVRAGGRSPRRSPAAPGR